LQVLINHLDFDMNILGAVEQPRIHFEKGELNIEPGFDSTEMKKIRATFDTVSEHLHKGVFFGGVHAAVRDNEGNVHGAGDERRSGVTKTT
jgi:gamma-glutamyltranspeptidase/glutathione hydrolase